MDGFKWNQIGMAKHLSKASATKTGKLAKAAAGKPGTKSGNGSGGGGPTASGGFNYQAAVTAITGAFAMRGAPLLWLDGLVSDVVLSVASETGEGGDDLRLVLDDESIVEVQVKKGLAKGASLWTALLDLARPLHKGDAQYAVLVVSQGSSATIREKLAKDVVALGEGRKVEAAGIGSEFAAKLKQQAWDPKFICQRLRVVTVAAADQSDGDVRAALAHLASVCADKAKASAAWDRLYRDAHVMIATRGARDRAALAQVFRSAGLGLREDPSLPSGFIEKLCRWTHANNREFTILGVDHPLSLETAYIELDPYVEEPGSEVALEPNLAAAIARYHDWNDRAPARGSETSAPEALGRFYTRAVVVAGPGAGKSTLLARVAAAYAADGEPVLKARAKAVWQRMDSGQGFEEALFGDALDGAPISAAAARNQAGLRWTVLLDGLDESGNGQASVIKGLAAFAEGRPDARIVVTTRPVGYQRAGLATWRHYAVPGIPENEVDDALAALLLHVLPEADPRRPSLKRRVKTATERSGSGKAALRTPLMLGFAAALFAAGGSLGTSRTSFYRGVFDLVAMAPSDRVPGDPLPAPIRNRCLDGLGWLLVKQPEATRAAALAFCGQVLEKDLGQPPLAAAAMAERCLDYWRALGIVEDLSQAGENALAFVHKTFGEFTAGRFLAKADEATQRFALKFSETDPGLREAVAFAAADGLAPLVLAELGALGFTGDAGEQRLIQALDVLIDAKPALPYLDAKSVLDAAIAGALDDRQGPVGVIGLKLRSLAVLYPTSLLQAAEPLMESGQVWTRLVGLAVTFVADRAYQPLLGWVEAVAEVAGPKRADDDIRSYRRSDAFVELTQAFAYDVAKRVVAETTAEEASGIFARAFCGEDLNRVGFIIDMEILIQGTEVQPWWRLGREASLASLNTKGMTEAMQRAFLAFVRGLQPLNEDDAPSDAGARRPLYVLSAFLSLVDFGGTSLPELYPLAHFGEAGDVRWLWRNLALAAGLPLDVLWADAAKMERTLTSSDIDALTLMFQDTLAVDIPAVEWAAHQPAPFDEALLEQALRRPSVVVVQVAVHLAMAADVEIVRRIVGRLLLDGEKEALWAASRLSTRLPHAEALGVLFAHASVTPKVGTEYVIRHLAGAGVDEDVRRQNVLRAALLQKQRPAAAEAAGKWFASHPAAAEKALVTEAFEYWRREEEPSPKTGVVPPSPREDLLRGLLALTPEPLLDLLTRWKDPRSDVRAVVKSAFEGLLADDAALDDIVRAANARELPLEWLRALVGRADRLAKEQRVDLLACLDDFDPAVRLAVLPLLEADDLPLPDRRARLLTLRKDASNEIRERAATLLRTMPDEDSV